MRKCWRVREGWEGPLLAGLVLGWVPASLGAQLIQVGSLSDSAPVGWAFFAVLGVWFGVPLVILTGIGVAHLARIGLPLERVTEPVTTDLRASVDSEMSLDDRRR